MIVELSYVTPYVLTTIDSSPVCRTRKKPIQSTLNTLSW